MEQSKSIALIIMAVVAVVAIVGLILMFTTGKTGLGIYGGALRTDKSEFQKEFAYTRFIQHSPTMENPAAYGLIDGEPAPHPPMGGASEKFMTDTEQGVNLAATYSRDPWRQIPTPQKTCQILEFPGGVRANFGWGYQAFIAKAGQGIECFTKDKYGNLVSDLLPMYYGCCIR